MNLPPIGATGWEATVPIPPRPPRAAEQAPVQPGDLVHIQGGPAPVRAPNLQANLAAAPQLVANAGAAGIGGPFGPPLAHVGAEQLRRQLEGLPVAYFKPPRWKIFGFALDSAKMIGAQEAAQRVAQGQAVQVQAQGQPVQFDLRHAADTRTLEQFYRGVPMQGSAGVLQSQQAQGVQFLLSDGRAVDAYGAFRVLHDQPDQAVLAKKPNGLTDLWGVGNLHHAGLMKDWMGQPAQTEHLDALFKQHPNPGQGLYQLIRSDQLDYPRLYQALDGVRSQQTNAAAWVDYTRGFTERLQNQGFTVQQAGEVMEAIGQPAGKVELNARYAAFEHLALGPNIHPEDGLALYRVYARGCQAGCPPDELKGRLMSARDSLLPANATLRRSAIETLFHEATWPERLMQTLTRGAPAAARPQAMQAPVILPLAVKGPPGSTSTPINAGSTFRLNVPGMGWTLAKADNVQTRTHIEVLASQVDGLLPVPMGGSDRVVPPTFPIHLAQPAVGDRNVTAPAGLYSVQQFVPDCVELQTLIERGAVPAKPHPDFLRMRYLDMLLANRDRHEWNVLMDQNGRPHAIDNGIGLSTDPYYLPTRVNPDHDFLYDYVDYNNIGWRPFCGVPDQAAPDFLRESYRYALLARRELTDEKLGALVDSMRPLYPHVQDWNETLAVMKHNRDQMPEVIERTMQRRGITH